VHQALPASGWEGMVRSEHHPLGAKHVESQTEGRRARAHGVDVYPLGVVERRAREGPSPPGSLDDS
jgi:hypothetical protein